MKRALSHLKKAGLRVTSPRLEVIRAVASSHRAQSAYDIHHNISAKGGHIDVVSVYRILRMLRDVGLVHHIGIVDGFVACSEDADVAHAAEHLVCSECGCVTELTVKSDAEKSLSGQAHAAGFKPEEMRVEMLGICGHCSARA